MQDQLRHLPGLPFVESPLFESQLPSADLTAFEQDVAIQLNRHGYAVIDFPDPQINARIDRIKKRISEHFGIDLNDPGAVAGAGDLRVQDAWMFDEDVKAIGSNPALLDLLSKIYGRRAFPFQTLNFPVGTQQHPHSDCVHFSSLPERFMCGVWVAFEDISASAGPLVYYPGSHKWPVLTNGLIGRRGWASSAPSAQTPFEDVWNAMAEASGIAQETFLPRKGQALIWAANLLHGGKHRDDRNLTRWSQVTHYYFEDCIYYTPAFSDEFTGDLLVRDPFDFASGTVRRSQYLGAAMPPKPGNGASTSPAPLRKRLRRKLVKWLAGRKSGPTT